jgi:hypothetical protein
LGGLVYYAAHLDDKLHFHVIFISLINHFIFKKTEEKKKVLYSFRDGCVHRLGGR